ncbi:MAG TPA: MBL fold metallo-hydrolase [Nitrococcus sp.]|nr:MBL fold metallo-hydrolase [Nitrococcus sp.]
MMSRPNVQSFLHEPSATFSYVVWDPQTRQVAVIDAVLDFDESSAQTSTASANRIIEFIRGQGLTVTWLLETHAHADHLAGCAYLKQEIGGRRGIGEGIRAVQAHFREVFNLEQDFRPDGSQFEHLFTDQEPLQLGAIEGRAMATPGHTSDSFSYRIGDAVFVGDTIFMPDGGTARCDFPGGSASILYRSIQRLYALPPETRVFVLHDYYPPDGREHRCETTIGEQRRSNIHVRDGVPEAEFVKLRTERDRTLALPRLIIPAVQINIRGGELPPAEANGLRYIKIPLNSAGGFSQIAD